MFHSGAREMNEEAMLEGVKTPSCALPSRRINFAIRGDGYAWWTEHYL